MASTASGTAGPPDRGARPALTHGWTTLRANLVPLLVVTAVWVLVEALLGAVGPALDPLGVGTVSTAAIEVALSLVVSVPVGAALGFAYLETTRGTEPRVADLLDGYDHLAPLVVATVVLTLAVAVGLVLLVLPGLYVGVRLGFAPLLVMDRGMDGLEALEASWRHTAGEALSLVVLLLASIVIVIAGVLLLVVGVVPAAAWVGCSWAGYYRSLVGEPTETPSGA